MCDIKMQREVTFQSTHPTRGCDADYSKEDRAIIISIHAPHEGVRLQSLLYLLLFPLFQSTHPTRGCDNS